MFSNLQNIFGCMDGLFACEDLLLFFLLLIAINCFCCGDSNLFSGFDESGCDNLLFFFLLVVVLFYLCDFKNDCD